MRNALFLLLFVVATSYGKDVPEVFRAQFSLQGREDKFVVEFNQTWSPRGVQRVYELIKERFYDDAGFFRVLRGFVVQFGLAADPKVNHRWTKIRDDPRVPGVGNRRGTLSFAMAGPHTRTTQLFINLVDNAFLDNMNFTPLGRVVRGMKVIQGIQDKYKEMPLQSEINSRGNEYLKEKFPDLDYIKDIQLLDTDE